MTYRIHDNLAIAFVDLATAKTLFPNRKENLEFVAISVEEQDFEGLLSLGQLFHFKSLLDDFKAGLNKELVICGGKSRTFATVACCLVGALLILEEDWPYERVTAAFQQACNCFMPIQGTCSKHDPDSVITVHDIWTALERTKALGWLNFKGDDVDIEKCIDMQEYMHYDSPVNGLLHVVIPSRVIAFNLPAKMYKMDEWNGCDYVDIGGKRFFGPRYYADILAQDYGVDLLVRCGDVNSSGRDFIDESFEGVGVAVESLAIRQGDGERPAWALLREVDRFLTLSRLSPGPLAVMGASGPGLGSGLELLLTSLLIREWGFPPRAALAWVRMVHPQTAGPMLTYSVVTAGAEDELDDQSGPCVRRCLSAPSCWADASIGQAPSSLVRALDLAIRC